MIFRILEKLTEKMSEKMRTFIAFLKSQNLSKILIRVFGISL